MEHIGLDEPLPRLELIGMFVLPAVAGAIQEEGDVVCLEAELSDGHYVVDDAVA